MAPYLYHAARNGAWRTVGELPDRKQAEYVASDGKTALHWVCSYSDFPLRVIQALLEAFPGAALIRDSSGHVPLHIAYIGASKDVILELRSRCPQAEMIRNNWGWTPAMMSVLLEADISCSEVMSDNSHPPSYHFFKKNNDAIISRFPLPDECDANTVLSQLGIVYQKAKLLLETEVKGKNFPEGAPFLMVHATLRVSSCPWSFFHLSLRLFPEQLLQEDHTGELPLHLAAASSSLSDGEFYTCESCRMSPITGIRYLAKFNWSSVYCHGCIVQNEWNITNYHEFRTCKKGPTAIEELLSLYPSAATLPNSKGRLALNIALENRKYWDQGIKPLFEISPESICIRDIGTHMYPFMVGAAKDHEVAAESSSLFPDDYLQKFSTVYALLIEAPHLLDIRHRQRNV